MADQRLERLVAERVDAQRRDERDRGPEAGGRHGLVAALAAVVSAERAAEHGLAGLGQALGADDEVDVDRPDDEDPPAHDVARRGDGVTNR